MQQLYNELTSPVIIFNDKGEQVQSAPTALMLRASRSLKQLADTNDTNNALVQKLQALINEAYQENEYLRKENESLREGEQKVSDVGSKGLLDQRDDSTSEEGDKPEGGNPSTS